MARTRLPVPERVNSLTPLYFVPKSPEKLAHWVCRCDCGKECEKVTNSLVTGKAKSCGCEKYAAVAAGLSKALTKHGYSGENAGPTYAAWKALRSRCNNRNDRHYPGYGARGIKVCARWDEFANFLADMGERPEGKTSIDRVDVNRGYEPGNCEWADSHQQARHRTDNVLIEYDGRTQCLSDWATEVGLGRKTIKRRLAAGWSIDRALKEPISDVYAERWETRRKRGA